jgi:hypothetical protein
LCRGFATTQKFGSLLPNHERQREALPLFEQDNALVELGDRYPKTFHHLQKMLALKRVWLYASNKWC